MSDRRPTLARDDIASQKLRRLFDYWDSKKAGRALPARAALDPVDFSWMLPGVALVDVLRDPLRFRYRLVGTEIVRRDGADLTGKSPEDHPLREYRDLLRQTYGDAVASGQPAVYRRKRVLDDRMRQYEVLYLPLAADGVSVDMLLVAIDFG